MGCSWAVLVGVGLLLFGEVVEAVSDEREEVLAADLQVVRGDDGLVDLRGEQVVTGGFLEQRVAVFEEAAFARKRLDDALRFEFGVGLGDGVAVDAELLGERADAGERLAGPQRAGRGGGPDLVRDLEIDREAGLEVELKEHEGGASCVIGLYDS